MDTIGAILKQAREKQGSALQAVYEATKITIPNLSALEENRFDFFPNKVYARAFLRDYANYLGIDSSDLIIRYETEWNTEPAIVLEDVAKHSSKSSKLKYVIVTVLIVLAVFGGGIYYYLQNDGELPEMPKFTGNITKVQREEHITTLPKLQNIEPDKPLPVPVKPLTPPQPAAVPVVQNKLVLEVTAIHTVWVGIIADGKRLYGENIVAGSTKKFEALKKIHIRCGMAGAVQIKLNGKPQPSLGSLKVLGDKEFILPSVPAQPKPIMKQ